MNYKKMLRKKHKVYGSFAMTGMAIVMVLLILGTMAYLNKDWIIEQFEGKGDLGVPRGGECVYDGMTDTSNCQKGLFCVFTNNCAGGGIVACAPPTNICMTAQECETSGRFLISEGTCDYGV